MESAERKSCTVKPVPSVKRDMIDAVRGRGFKAVTREALKREMEAACGKSSAKKVS